MTSQRLVDRSPFIAVYKGEMLQVDHLLGLFDENGHCRQGCFADAQQGLKALKERWKQIERMHRDTEVESIVREARCELYSPAKATPGPKWASELHSARGKLSFYARG